MARHSSITRRVLYMCPSNVQFVRSSIRTRSSRPSSRKSSSAFLMVCKRNGAIHGVLREREGLDVERLAAAQDEPVVVRFVAVAVDDHDVARRHEGLDHHLVAGRRAVGDEEYVVGPKRPRGDSWAFLMLPVGSSRLSRPPVVALLSARNRLMP